MPRRAPPASRTVPLATTLLSLALAGCLGAVEDPEAGLDAGSAEVEAPAAALSGITAFHWASDEELGDTALRLALHFPTSNPCRTLVGTSGVHERPGTHVATILEQSNGAGWHASGGGSLVTAYAGPVDTRTVLGGGGRYGSISASNSAMEGGLILTTIAQGLTPWDEHPWMPGKSLAYSFTCEEPFDVMGAWIGDEAVLWSVERLDGLGADVVLVGNAAVAATGSAAPTYETSGFYMGSFGIQAGAVLLDHPGGSESWVLPLDSSPYTGGSPTIHLPSGPGNYDLAVTRGAARFDTFWAAVYGLGGPLDLLPGLLEESAIDAPFA